MIDRSGVYKIYMVRIGTITGTNPRLTSRECHVLEMVWGQY
ncbi:hypothetical protein NCCP28_19040 [Niallia sp. NCCP-28]|nr:hypothetical protein NCCP28_19040 [Niallia sp. NCCP-28]